MTIDRSEFDNLTVGDIQSLIDGEVPEGFRLEYKSALYGNSDADRKELLKDVTAFANAHGGHLILGIEEQDGVAHRLVSVCDDNVDAEILRIDQALRTGVESPIVGIRIKAIPLDAGGHIIVIRIPHSWNQPHRVIARGSNRFYIRNSAGVHEPTVGELRLLFSQASSALDKAKEFRNERIQRIVAGEPPRPLAGSGRIVVHIVPVASFSGLFSVDLEAAHIHHDGFWPIGTQTATSRFNYHGFAMDRAGEQNYGYTQVFRNGCVEATKANLIRELDGGRRVIPGRAIERHIFQSVPSYFEALVAIGVPLPFLVFVTLLDVAGVKYALRNDPFDDYPEVFPEDTIYLPEGMLEGIDARAEMHSALRPAFDAIWNTCGFVRAQTFADNGEWVEQR